ncbi:MAG: hypothetical protein AAGD35_21030 [Actinomycetota bacterium]
MTFDDDVSDQDLYVFSGHDLLITHYDGPDLDWQEIAERSAIDSRRGLVIAQVAALEDIIDEFIHYIEDPKDWDALQSRLDRRMIGSRITQLEHGLDRVGLLGPEAEAVLAELRAVVERRNQLAHGQIVSKIVGFPESAGRLISADADVEVEWVLLDRRRRTSERLSMTGLREDLEAATAAFMATLGFAEWFVERAPWPEYFQGGAYLGVPTP